MQFWHRLKTLWRNVSNRQKVEKELDDEIRSYREMLEDEKARTSADPSVARREALLELGGAEQIKEAVRDVRLGVTLDAIGAELRQSLRGLRRNPGLTVLATLMLALGMGASTAVFSIFYSALLRPLPFRDSDRLVQISETRLARGIDRASFSEANFWDVRSRNRSFVEVGTYHYGEANLTGDGPSERVTASFVSTGFFRALGVSPVLGRDFSYEESRDGMNHVAILGNQFWRSRFGGDANILGRTMRLNDHAYTVIGVLPPGEPWINGQLYIPIVYHADADRGSWEFAVIGRLAPRVTVEAAQADLRQIAAVLGRTYPNDDKGIGFRLDSSSGWVAADNTRRALWVLLGAVTFLLLIGCLNMANLLLARGTARQREIAVRTALGAGRARLMRFVMMESLLLSAFGAALGVALAWAVLNAIRVSEVSVVPRLADADLNPWALGFAVVIAIVTGVLSGVAPALQAQVSGIVAALRDGDRQTGSRGQGRVRAVLVTGEVALSFLLLAGAGLLIRSFTELMKVNRGFQTENRLVFSVSMPGSYYEKGVGKQFLDRFLERLSAVPQVVAAGAVSNRPVEGGDPGMGIDSSSGTHTEEHQTAPWAGWRIVSPGYFRAIGLPLLRGRSFDETDKPVWAERGQPEPQRRVIISERLARLIFPSQDPIGKHVILWKGQSGGDAEVIGVVGDSRERGLAADPTLTVYLPYGRIALTSEFVVHTRGNPLALMPAVRSIINNLDPNLPIADVRTFDEVVETSVAPQRFNAILLAVFSGLALLLATTGIYGVLSYSMSRRTSEIGLRVALGASTGSILRMTIGQGMQPALVGIVLGGIGAAWFSRYFASLLFGVKPFDALTYAAVAVLLLLTALVACYLPGRRAMTTDPSLALRIE
ncbi:MAG TPA: ABC transporter permease [Bryobacteraceae bacterium]|nr:ABC transporter permease [Bryobacteraceae bacterium]